MTYLLREQGSCLIQQQQQNQRDNAEVNFSNENSIRRFKRQDPSDQFIDNIFQIPISTLNAVNDLIKSTRPMIQRARERIQQQYNTWQQSQSQTPQQPKPVKNKAKITRRTTTTTLS